MGVLADDAKRLLGRTATWKEKFVLGGASFYDDITVSHCAKSYFNSIYETEFKLSLCAKLKSKAQEQ